jgi:DNA-binding MarR family transcriptional regulator
MNKPRPRRSGKLSKPDYEQLAEFRYRLRCFLRFSETATHSRGITSLQYQLMLQIKGFPGREHATIGELAERLQAKHHGVVSLVTRCEEAGLVSRNLSASDKRRVEVRLTPGGEKCLAELARMHRAELKSLQDVFSLPGGNTTSPKSSKRPRAPTQEKKR